MSQQVFAQYIDMSPASLSSIFNGRTRPTLNIVEAIKRKIPNISTDWLMFGTGEMYKSGNDSTSISEQENGFAQEQALDFGSDDAPTLQPAVAQRHHDSVQSARIARQEAYREDVKYVDKPQRRVMEIRVYYDDLTFESFVPAKK